MNAGGRPDLSANELTREALWGKPQAFRHGGSRVCADPGAVPAAPREPPLRYGRLYFREVSGNGVDFGYSSGRAGWSRFRVFWSTARS